MKTQLILFHRPARNQFILDGTDIPSNDYAFRAKDNPNEVITEAAITIGRGVGVIDQGAQIGQSNYQTGNQGLSIDLYDGIPIPITYTILDVREPEKRKTSWSKTITIPGTKNNNRIFSHIYEIGQDGWITIGNTSVYESFNPNLRKEVIVLNDGIQVMKGNLQMKRIKRDKNGNIEYEIALNGDLTSLFYDVGNTKLSDLDFSELDHAWSKDNMQNSWYGMNKNSEGQINMAIADGTRSKIKNVYKDPATGRLAIETFTAHGLLEDDYVYLDLRSVANWDFMNAAKGEYIVTQRVSSTKFVVNYIWPYFFNNIGQTITVDSSTGFESWAVKKIATGSGWVYPLVSWGDEYDYNSFPTTALVPGVYIKGIFDKIMKMTNSNYQSTFLNSQFFKRLFIIQKKSSYDLSIASVQERKFCVGLTQSFTTGASYKAIATWRWANMTSGLTNSIAAMQPADYALKVPFQKESGSNGTASYYDGRGATAIGNWNQTTYKWMVQDTGEFALRARVNVSAWVDMNGYTNGTGNSTYSFTPMIQTNPNALPAYLYYPGTWQTNPSGPVGTNTTGMQVKAVIYRKTKNNLVEEIGSTNYNFSMNGSGFWQPTNPNWKWFGRYQPASWENRTLEVVSNKTYFEEGDEVWCEVSHYVQALAGAWSNITSRKCGVGFFEIDRTDPREPYRSNINGEFYYRVESTSFIINDPSPKSSENSLLEANNFLPKDLSCKDFLLSIIKMFNLHIEADKQIERKYYIEPRDTYYRDGTGGTSDYVDWSTKVDNDSVDIVPMGELIAKYYTFQNKEESDSWNKKFKEDRGRPYMKYTKEIENDFLKNEVKIEIPLGSTVMINNPDGTDVVMPAVLQIESNNSFKPVSNSAPRILIWGGLRPYTAGRGGAWINLNNSSGAQYGWEILSSSASSVASASASVYRQYPYAGTVDCPIDPVYDINWYNMEQGDFVYWDNARWTNENLYNKYWSNFINEISDPASKVIIANLRLTPKDIFELDFRKIYVIDGHYLRLQKVIDYDPVTNGLTRCEFLKLKSPSKFVRRSQITDSGGVSNPVFSQVVDTTRPIGLNLVEIAPSKKRPNFGFTNTSSVDLSNSATVQTNGLSNFVAPGSKNIKVNGNENAVGTNTQNINITAGDGNYIVGSVKNVNMIGTSKKYIEESDVTYINDVRYKNGIAISKANVINACLDVALVKQSINTTANVINAGEDTVISAGSTSYENVINSGLDTILPDLKELGVSTAINPNSRTNLSGVVGTIEGLATYSVATQIRYTTANISFS